MTVKRYGPEKGAGVTLTEKEAEKQIEQGALGTTVYVGIMERGPVGELFRAKTKTSYTQQAGGIIDDSLLPDVAFDFYKTSRGAGELWLLRITDGTEVQSEVTLKGRANPALEYALSANSSGQYFFISTANYVAAGSPGIGSRVNVYNDNTQTGVRNVTGVDLDTPAAGTVRLTVDGGALTVYTTVLSSEVIFYNTATNPDVVKVLAANGGKWGGKFAVLYNLAFGGGGLAATTFDTGETMLEDAMVGALLSFNAMPGRSYEVISNTTAGVVTVSSDSDMATDYAATGSSDETWALELANGGLGLEVVIKDGLQNPTTEWGMDIYLDGILVLEKYTDMSSDPTSEFYFLNTINDDDSNTYIEVEDLWVGAISAAIRPANSYAQSTALTGTVLTGDTIVQSTSGTGDGTVGSITYGGSAKSDTVTLACLAAGAKAVGTVQITDNTFDVTAAIIVGDDVTATYAAGNFTTSTQNKFNLNLYGQGNVEVTLNLAACTTGANTATEMTTKINAAIATGGYVGTVLVTWSVDHLVITTVGTGRGLEVNSSDTGASGGAFATEAKLTLALWTSYTAGDGDYIRVTFDSGVTNYDFNVCVGTVPALTGRFVAGGNVDATALALKNAMDAYAQVFAQLVPSVLTDTVTCTVRVPSLATGWALTESDGAGADFTVVDFAGGANQTWSYTSTALGLIAGATPITGTAFVAPNDFLIGMLITQGAVDFIIGDTITIVVTPWVPNAMVNGYLYPDAINDRRTFFKIISNTFNTITVKTGSVMTENAKIGDSFRVQYLEEMSGGYDGIAGIIDSTYEAQLDSTTSPINSLRGQKKGLTKIAIPGITSTAIQQAGAAYAEARNYQFRYEIPANVTTDEAAEAYLNDTLGRNEFAVITFPSYMYVSHPTQAGLKLIPATGAIHGVEALFAKTYEGYHKASAGEDAKISHCIKLPTGVRVLDEELLNPQGIGVLKFVKGNCIIWGDRTCSATSDWKWKHQRETMSQYENDLLESFNWIIFTINDEDTQSLGLAALQSYFRPEWKKRAVRGKTFDEAVQLKLDNEINTDITRATGDMNTEISLRLADTTERFNIIIGKMGIFENVA